MLDDYLIPHTEPVARKEQIYCDSRVRITVLTPRLVRVETNGHSEDRPSQIVWFRKLERCPFNATQSRLGVTIKTAEAAFFYSYAKKRVTYVILSDTRFAGKKIKTDEAYQFNLKGTVRSLDNAVHEVSLSDGILSRSGVAVLEDNSMLLQADGLLTCRKPGGSDTYVFAASLNYRAALQDFYKITGPVPLLPRAVLGNWWSRWKAYTQNEYMDLMKRFQTEHIPFSIATVDMDWHIVDIKRKFPDYKSEHKGLIDRLFWGDGWTGYTWERELFPDHIYFLRWLHENGYKTVLNLHPSSGVRWFEDKYPEMAKAVGIDPATKETVHFNMSDSKFIKAYFDLLHRPYEKDGVDWWWVDWQQGHKSKQAGLDPLWALNHYHSLHASRGGHSLYANRGEHLSETGHNSTARGIILSRYSGAGSHRYPIGFSGDTKSSWRVLKFLPYFTLTASNIGYTWWSHDIGGHWGGIKNDELYLRWLQFGVYSPINRLHSTRNDLMGKEVWNYRPDIAHYARRLLIRRQKFLPYNYTMNYRTHTQGIPICEPLYYQYSDSSQAYKYRNQYFFGSELLICPITSKSSKSIALATVKVWLPKGRWTDIYTDRVYDGDCEITLAREIHEIPVFAREGAIIPNINEDEIDCIGLPSKLNIYVYRGTNLFSLYEDNGTDFSYKQGNFCITQFEANDVESHVDEKGRTIDARFVFRIKPATGGGIENLPKKRDYDIILKDIVGSRSISVTVNGKQVKQVIKSAPLAIKLLNIKPADSVEISVDGYESRKNLPFGGEVVRLFSRLNLGNIRKHLKFRRLRKYINDKKRFESRLRLSRIPKVLKLALKELIQMEN